MEVVASAGLSSSSPGRGTPGRNASSGPQPPAPAPEQRLVTVPELARLPLARAKAALSHAGLEPGPVTHRPTRALPGQLVISSRPSSGEQVSPGSTVKLVVSSDINEIILPRLIGLKLERAKRRLKQVGLKIGQIKYKYDDRRRGLVILRQRPGPGAMVAKGTAVDLLVNEGD